MLKYTRAALWKMLLDFKRIAHVISIVLYSVSVLYPIYAIIAGNGYLAANIALAAIALMYLIFYLITYNKNSREEKNKKSKVKQVYKWSKRGISLLTLGITVYSIYFTAQDMKFHTLLITAFMVVFWVVDASAALITIFIENRIDLFSSAIAMDFEGAARVGNFFKRAIGDEVTETEIPQKNREALERMSEAHSEVVRDKQEQKKLTKKARRAQRINTWMSRVGIKKKPDDTEDIVSDTDGDKKETAKK